MEQDIQQKGRSGDGITYLVVADETEEFAVALRYAANLAESNRGHLAILHVVEIEDFQNWGSVERMMRRELREKAEMFLWEVAKKVNDLGGAIPALYVAEGLRTDALIEIVNADPDIGMLVLGGGTGAAGPGPLVGYFTGKGIGRLRVPVLVVPGNLERSSKAA